MFIDSGEGLVLSIWFLQALEANSLGAVWCSYNEWTNHLCVYRRLLTIAYMVEQLNYVWLTAEITVATTKYIEYITHPACVHGMRYSFYHVVLVKFYCDVITSH